MGKQRRGVWISAAVGAVLLAATGGWLAYHYEALVLLEDIVAGAGSSRLKATTQAPLRTAVTYAIADRPGNADLYLPAETSPQAGVVLVPGAVPEGKREPRLVALAQSLARMRFAVLVPELAGYRELRIQASQVDDVGDAFRYLLQREDLAPAGRLGIAAFSYAVGPALLAALQDDLSQHVRFVLAVGGYRDLTAAIRFFTTGYFEHGGELRHLQPDPYPLLVLARTLAGHVREPADRRILEAMVAARLEDRAADLGPLARGLGAEGQSVYRLLTNRDPALTPSLIAALPPASRETIAALTLPDKKLAALPAHLILVHGRNDRLIPYTESLALARAVAPGRADVFILHRVLGHVDLGLSGLLSLELWAEQLPDAARLVRATSLLLRQRRADSTAERAAEPQFSY